MVADLGGRFAGGGRCGVGRFGFGFALGVLGLEIGDLLRHVDAREQRFALVHGVAAADHAGRLLAQQAVQLVGVDAELLGHLGRGVGQVGLQQRGDQLQRAAQVEQHLVEPRPVGLVLGQHPGRGLVDVLVGALHQLKDVGQRGGHIQRLHVGVHAGGQVGHQAGQRFVDGRVLHRAAEVFLTHRDRAGEQVAQVVGQVGVDAVDQRFVGERAVVAERHFAQQEVAHGVHAVAVAQLDGVDDVALRFAHLAAAQQQPAVAEHFLGQRQVQRHQHGGPDDGMEAQNLLAHHVQVGGPELVIVVVGVVAVTQRRDIVGKRVDPHIDRVLGVERHRDAPAHAGAGHTGVLQALLDESDHLVLAGGGLDEIGVVLVVLQQAVGIFAGLEEIRFLLGFIHGAAAVGAAAVLQLRFGPEALARLAVHALVGAFIDVALLVQPGKDGLHALDVVVVGRADEPVIGDVHHLPQVLDRGHNGVHIFFGRHALGGGLVLDLLAVLVGAGQKHHVVAFGALVAGDGVAGHRRVAVADVQLVAGVVDGGRNVKLFVVHGRIPLLCIV